MRAFRLTRNEFALVVGPSGFNTLEEASLTPRDGEDKDLDGHVKNGTAGSGEMDWRAQTILAEVGGVRIGNKDRTRVQNIFLIEKRIGSAVIV